ncbi:MAG: hypothetical protein HY079_11265 [Elusimicrobia bacterium]|nr:hypothetical protein [Elusimicrobiota bacterium]
MADKPEGEQIKIKVDGVPAALESLPPELRAEVEARIADARKSLESKYPKGKLRMNINVKWKTSKAALAKSGAPAPKPVAIVDEGSAIPWPVVIFLLFAAAGAAYLFVPSFTAAADKVLAALHKT